MKVETQNTFSIKLATWYRARNNLLLNEREPEACYLLNYCDKYKEK